MRVTVSSFCNAEKKNSPIEHRNHKKKKAYVALLQRGVRETIDRKFVGRSKIGGRYMFFFKPLAFDIYEIRRWNKWDEERQCFTGGTTYIGFDKSLNPASLTRDEAISALWIDQVNFSGEEEASALIQLSPNRIIPEDIKFDLSS